ncbi:MAG: transglycosylase SLT domain-containing protein [Pseudorhizobium sp.]
MVMNRAFGRTALVSLAVTTALAGCSSVESTTNKTARLQGSTPAAQETVATTVSVSAEAPVEMASTPAPAGTLAKTGRIHIAIPNTTSVASVQQAAMSAPQMAPQVAYATSNPVSATTAAAAIQSVAAANTVAVASEATPEILQSQAVVPGSQEADANELTPDMRSLQAAIPIPRPDIKALGYASATPAPAAVSTLQAVDTRRIFPPAPGEALPATASASPPELTKLIKHYAGLYGIPESLIHRVVQRESRYNPKAYHKDGYWGLMQIKYATAKSMGYNGRPEGLLDAETNLKYATKYLRGAWLVADNSNDNAIRLYARGYYYDAKRKNMLHVLKQ